jgi:ABC-type nitrate/sulfonate/bicarbonate transport system ATPase subunit
MIEVTNLTKERLQNNKQVKVFDNFNLLISHGERVGLFGENGVGKSTLLDSIIKLDKDFTGKIETTSTNIAYVHQNTKDTLLPWMTCKDNIFKLLEYKKVIDLDKKEVLYKKLLNDLNVDFDLLKNPSELSGGQRQMVSFISSVMQEPEILLLDEPFSAIDSDRRKKMIHVLETYLPDTTVIICSHRGSEISDYINRVVVLQNQPTNITQDFKKEDTTEFKKSVEEISFTKYEK